MNDDARDDTTNQPISLNNAAAPYAVVSDRAAPYTTSSAGAGPAFAIVPDAHGGGRLVNALEFEFGKRNTSFFSLFPGVLVQEETRQKLSLGQESAADTGLQLRRLD